MWPQYIPPKLAKKLMALEFESYKMHQTIDSRASWRVLLQRAKLPHEYRQSRRWLPWLNIVFARRDRYDTALLSRGDTIHFDGSMPHVCIKADPVVCRCLCVYAAK